MKDCPIKERVEELLRSPDELKRLMAKFPEFQSDFKLKRDARMLAHYLALREHKKANTHKFSAMIACRSFPAISTDTSYAADLRKSGKMLGDQYSTAELSAFKAAAKAKGATINPNYVYIDSMAQYPGDPKAFLDPQEARSAMKRYCEREGIGCEALGTKHRQPDKDPLDLGAHISPEITASIAMQEFMQDERNKHLPVSKQKKKLADLNAKAKDKHAFDSRRLPTPVTPETASPRLKTHLNLQ